MAALSEEDFRTLAAGMAVVRAQYDGFRRNAILTLGAQREQSSRSLLERLCADASPVVADAARWALERLNPASA
jgi:epoxyqueuosine reductase